jgi:hypothetical protein
MFFDVTELHLLLVDGERGEPPSSPIQALSLGEGFGVRGFDYGPVAGQRARADGLI